MEYKLTLNTGLQGYLEWLKALYIQIGLEELLVDTKIEDIRKEILLEMEEKGHSNFMATIGDGTVKIHTY